MATRVVKQVSALRADFKVSVVLTLIPVIVAISMGLTACGDSKVIIPGADNGLVSTKVTMGGNEPIWPNDDPSVPDGGGVYQAQNCAACHGVDGKPVAGKSTVDFSSKDWGRQQKPVDEYDFVTFGKKGVEHPKMQGVLRPSQIWNLVFYVRSLSTAPLTDAEIADVLPVFGANCAVCHGTKGYGNGPLMKGNTLEPLPANFQSFPRFFDRTDDVLWDHIANGIKWEGMPNFLGKVDKKKNVTFDRDYCYKLVGFVRHFHESNKTEAATKEAHQKEDKEDKQPPTSTKPQT
ncbi:MAG: c-type cytochrome [Cyanobacteria bacterium REEB67]|nr:c-type cytochrome [Cyanobacteria bacterium REEB67]